VHQLWVERAAKIIRQATHIGNLIEHFEFMGDIAFRLTDETLPSLKKSMNENKQEKSELINEIKQFVELYQTYTITDYDYWNYENASIF
jgi:hypothetical protein